MLKEKIAKSIVKLAERTANCVVKSASVWTHYQPKEPKELRN